MEDYNNLRLSFNVKRDRIGAEFHSKVHLVDFLVMVERRSRWTNMVARNAFLLFAHAEEWRQLRSFVSNNFVRQIELTFWYAVI